MFCVADFVYVFCSYRPPYISVVLIILIRHMVKISTGPMDPWTIGQLDYFLDYFLDQNYF